MTRRQYCMVMMLLWGIIARLDHGSLWSTGAYLIGFLYAVEGVIALWKERNEVHP